MQTGSRPTAPTIASTVSPAGPSGPHQKSVAAVPANTGSAKFSQPYEQNARATLASGAAASQASTWFRLPACPVARSLVVSITTLPATRAPCS